ncbi:MAG TPA: hypothetical protein VG963_27480 [Polyangiaceae bacterium]|nr:hypothetical protein [Polyangiaceae bacterium]
MKLARWFVRGVMVALSAYALTISIIHQVHHTYPAVGPRALEDTRPKQIQLGTFLRGDRAPLSDMLGHGWYGIESGTGRWSAGLSSELTLPEQDVGVDLELRLRLLAAADGEHSTNPTRVVLHGRELAELDVRINVVSDYVVRVPAGAHQGYPLLLVFDYSFAVQPSPQDPRNIAIRLEGLELRRMNR